MDYNMWCAKKELVCSKRAPVYGVLKEPHLAVAPGLGNPSRWSRVTCRFCLPTSYVSGHNPVGTGSRPDTTTPGVFQQTLRTGYLRDKRFGSGTSVGGGQMMFGASVRSFGTGSIAAVATSRLIRKPCWFGFMTKRNKNDNADIYLEANT